MTTDAACPNAKIIDQMRMDLYHGDMRKPGLTTRMEELEGQVASANRKLNWICGLLVTTLVSVIVELVKAH